MKKLKLQLQIIKSIAIQTFYLYSIIYLIQVFCIWEFNDPIYWIKQMPSYDHGERFTLLFFITMYFLIEYFVWEKVHTIEKENKESSHTESAD